MSGRARVLLPILLVVGVVVAAVALTGGLPGIGSPGASGGPGGPGGPGASDAALGPGDSSGNPPGTSSDPPLVAPTPTPRPPEGGTELYGYLPYWQMTGSMATYLQAVPVSTLALFSVTARRNGAVDNRPTGYARITGGIGRRLIDEAHARGTRVELVFTSFGEERNGILFGRIPRTTPAPPTPAPSPRTPISTVGGSAEPAPTPTAAPPPWERTVIELVDLALDLGVDGINVDVELLAADDRPAYGEFLAALRAALRAARPDAQVSVATEAGPRGVQNAAAAAGAGVDRIFLMGYEYHWSGSAPGASSPVDRADGRYTLRWSITEYVEAGVPRDRILLGLPLYGMSWRTVGPDRTSAVVTRGRSWIPSQHTDVLLRPGFRFGRDSLEVADFFAVPDGDAWRITYYDSPGTIKPKLALARDSGLAGAGFWALGYERGLPGYLEVMESFRAGRIARADAPGA